MVVGSITCFSWFPSCPSVRPVLKDMYEGNTLAAQRITIGKEAKQHTKVVFRWTPDAKPQQ